MSSAAAVGGIIYHIDKEKKHKALFKSDWPYRSKKLLSSLDLIFYNALKNAFPQYVIFLNVKLAQLIGVKGSNWHITGKHSEQHSTIKHMSVEFALCFQNKVVAVFDFRENSNDEKEELLKSLGVIFFKYKKNQFPNISAIKARIEG